MNYLRSLYSHMIRTAESPIAACTSRHKLSSNARIIYEFRPTLYPTVSFHSCHASFSFTKTERTFGC